MKKIFHDIIPNDKRSIRNIPITKKDGQNIHEIDERFSSPTAEERREQSSAVSPQSSRSTEQASRPVVSTLHHTVDGITRSKVPTHTSRSSVTINTSPNTQTNHDEDDYEYEDETPVKKAAVGTNSKAAFARKEADPAFYEGHSEDFDDSNSNFEEWDKHHKKSFTRPLIALIVLACILLFVLANIFGGATIKINPVKHDLVLKETKVALNQIGHEMSNTELGGSEEVAANGTAKVERKATGRVILYNAYNSSVQRLVINTRLETPNGLVYMTKSAVSIPGQKTVNGKLVPGSVEVDVEASEIGDKYNQGFKDFNVVAYKGSDRYEGIYGRSKTALANGFSGTVPNIATKDINDAVAKIKEKINTEADEFFTKKAKSKGDNYAYIPSTKKITYSETKNEVSKDGKKATIKIEAKVTAVLFDSTTLFAEIIKSQNEQIIGSTTETTSSVDMSKEIVYTGDFSKLNIAMSDDAGLSVTGTTTISSAIDTVKITRAVSGLSREQAIGALKRLIELETVEIDIRPWWNKKLPSASKIKIETEE